MAMLLFCHFKGDKGASDSLLKDDRFDRDCFRVMRDQLLLGTVSQFLLRVIDDVYRIFNEYFY